VGRYLSEHLALRTCWVAAIPSARNSNTAIRSSRRRESGTNSRELASWAEQNGVRSPRLSRPEFEHRVLPLFYVIMPSLLGAGRHLSSTSPALCILAVFSSICLYILVGHRVPAFWWPPGACPVPKILRRRWTASRLFTGMSSSDRSHVIRDRAGVSLSKQQILKRRINPTQQSRAGGRAKAHFAPSCRTGYGLLACFYIQSSSSAG